MFDSAPVGMALGDAEGRVIESNRALQELLGYAGEELRHMSYAQFTHPHDLPENVELSRELAEGKRDSFQIEKRYIRKNSRPIWVRVSVAGVPDEEGNWECAIVTVENIDARKKLEEQLLQSQKLEAIGRLAGGIAHDFNNLLTAIGGYSDLLLARDDLDGRSRIEIGEIKRAADRAATLTRQLLAFGRKQELKPQVLSLNDVVRETEGMLRRVIGEYIELVTDLAPDLGLARLDPGQFEQVIVNLALNARDAMPGGGKLTLRTENVERERAYVALGVRDTGVGMDEDTLAHVFEPFFTTKGEEGTGLGLATVCGIVEQSGGHVEVSSSPRRGTTFTILLPRVDLAGGATDHPSLAETLEGR